MTLYVVYICIFSYSLQFTPMPQQTLYLTVHMFLRTLEVCTIWNHTLVGLVSAQRKAEIVAKSKYCESSILHVDQ